MMIKQNADIVPCCPVTKEKQRKIQTKQKNTACSTTDQQRKIQTKQKNTACSTTDQQHFLSS